MKLFILLNFCFVVMCTFSVKAQQLVYNYTTPSGIVIEKQGTQSGPSPWDGTFSYYSIYVIKVTGATYIDLDMKNFSEQQELSSIQGLDAGIDIVDIYSGVPDAQGELNGEQVYNSAQNNQPTHVRVTGNSVTIQVSSLKQNPIHNNSSWEVSYQSDVPTSPTIQQYNYTNATGTFDDGSGDSEYANNFSGSYLVKPVGASKVTLNFSSFDVGNVYNGIVRVYDGENASASLLGTYSKDNAPVASLNSTSNAMFITFITDNTPGASGTTRSQGWAVNYSAVTNGAWDKIGSNLYYNSGNIGLGNTNAIERLTVTGNIAATGGLMANTIKATDVISAAKISATGTISASNINATEAITASAFGTTGTMSAKRFVATAMITAQGLTVTDGVWASYLNASGSISTPTVNASTLLKAPTIEATTILKASNVTVTGTVAAANVSATTGITAPTLTATGTITANAFKGDGAQITGINASQIGGSISASQISGNIPSSQIIGNIPSTQISGMIPSTQISGLTLGDNTGNVIVPTDKSLTFGGRYNTASGWFTIYNSSSFYNMFADFRGNLNFRNDGDWRSLLSLQSNGTVIINGGTRYDNSVQDTQGAALMVNGKILCEKIKVIYDVPNSDYVFEKNYKLKSLEEVEAFVKVHKHLEDIPSAEEFKKNGYSIGDMDNMLLRKVEEMTLLMIEQKKEIDALKKKVELLQKQ